MIGAVTTTETNSEHKKKVRNRIMAMFSIGEMVRIKINGVGYRKGQIVRAGLNSFWVEYKGELYLIATSHLMNWNSK